MKILRPANDNVPELTLSELMAFNEARRLSLIPAIAFGVLCFFLSATLTFLLIYA